MMDPRKLIDALRLDREHAPDCVCDRCKIGAEVFLLPGDIIAIQEDAIDHWKERAEQAEKHANELELSNSRQALEIIKLVDALESADCALDNIARGAIPHDSIQEYARYEHLIVDAALPEGNKHKL